MWQRTCAAGDMWGCHGLAYMYRGGVAVSKDEARARALFKKACAGGFAHACPLASP